MSITNESRPRDPSVPLPGLAMSPGALPSAQASQALHPAASLWAKRLGISLPLAIGTMYWGDSLLDQALGGHIIPTTELVKIKSGMRIAGRLLVDTAEGYGGGSSEARIGRMGLAREGHLVASKFLPTLWRWSSSSFRRAVETSNYRLRVQKSQLTFIHSPIHPRDPAVWVRGAVVAYQRGELLALGLSNFDADQVYAAYRIAHDAGMPLVANQILFSLLSYGSLRLRETVIACHELGISVIGYGGLGQGLLSHSFDAQRLTGNRFARRVRLNEAECQPLFGVLKTLAENYAPYTQAQICLAWVLAKGIIPLVGIRKESHLEAALSALHLGLADKDVAALDAVALAYSTFDRSSAKRAFFLPLISLLMCAAKIARLIPQKNMPN